MRAASALAVRFQDASKLIQLKSVNTYGFYNPERHFVFGWNPGGGDLGRGFGENVANGGAVNGGQLHGYFQARKGSPDFVVTDLALSDAGQLGGFPLTHLGAFPKPFEPQG